MRTKIYEIDGSPLSARRIKAAGEIIKGGGLVAFPTETVYGLGGDALNAAAAARIFAAKGRPADNPLIVHLYRIEDIEVIATEIPAVFYALAEKFWPGPLTVILKKSALVPGETTGGLSTVAVRIPNNQTALSLIEAAGGFIAAPSANLSGRPSPTRSRYVIEDMAGRVEMILTGGESEIGLESTILDLTRPAPEILRPGCITEALLSPIVGKVKTAPPAEIAPELPAPAPGMKYRHYAPRGQMSVVEGEGKTVVTYINERTAAAKANGYKTGVIATEQTFPYYFADSIKCIGDRRDDEAIARNLYRILREFDDEVTDVIYSETFGGGKNGQAIMNRLLKAASYRVIRLAD